MDEKEKQELKEKVVGKRAAMLTLMTILESFVCDSTIGTWGIDLRINVSDAKEYRQRCKDVVRDKSVG